MDANIIYILVVALVGGIVHQLMDRGKENDIKAVLRGLVVGVVAGWLAYISLLEQTIPENVMYLIVFTAGYTGDSVILNVIERVLGDKEVPNESES